MVFFVSDVGVFLFLSHHGCVSCARGDFFLEFVRPVIFFSRKEETRNKRIVDLRSFDRQVSALRWTLGAAPLYVCTWASPTWRIKKKSSIFLLFFFVSLLGSKFYSLWGALSRREFALRTLPFVTVQLGHTSAHGPTLFTLNFYMRGPITFENHFRSISSYRSIRRTFVVEGRRVCVLSSRYCGSAIVSGVP